MPLAATKSYSGKNLKVQYFYPHPKGHLMSLRSYVSNPYMTSQSKIDFYVYPNSKHCGAKQKQFSGFCDKQSVMGIRIGLLC